MKHAFLVLMACTGMNLAMAQTGLPLERTLRVDYIFSGDVKEQEISVAELCSFQGWAGRQHHLDSIPLRGNGILTMSDARDPSCILYQHSFSTLFQEWLNSEEATHTRKAFENVFLLPMPRDSVCINLRLYGNHDSILVDYTHVVKPGDILIRSLDSRPSPPHRYLLKSGKPEDCIDVAIVAEGYTAAESEAFYMKAQETVDALFAHAPFGDLRQRFNVVAVALASDESGVSIPGKGIWKQTALGSQFDTFYTERYLTTLHLRRLHDYLAPIPYEHIIILANTEHYGGGGIYNSYTLTMTNHRLFRPVAVHEFGHSFAGLADEYFYDDQYAEFYYPDTEPWEQNLTTLHDFASKWQDMLPTGIPIPTPADPAQSGKIGVYEGGGYQSKGVYRAFQECRMKINDWPEFCPVCQRAITRLVEFYTKP